MAVRSRRFFGPTEVVGASAALLYTVPAGRTAILRLILVTMIGAGTGSVVLRVNSSTGNPIWVQASGGVTVTLSVPGVIVLNPGDELRCNVPATMSAWWTGFGTLLLGEPT